MKLNGAQIIIKTLEKYGITVIPGIPGGANLPLYDALYESRVIRHVLARHEQSAGFIAQGMARSTGIPAVCFATSGPGATNLVTALADAKLDSIPIIAITGQVPTTLLGTDAFQEIDTFGMTLPLTKHNFLVKSAGELMDILPLAFEIAQTGRPGPVLIDMPKDVQTEVIDIPSLPERCDKKPVNGIKLRVISAIAEAINKSTRPVMYIGGGVIHSGSYRLICQLAKKNSIPVTSTLMGLGAYPADDRLSLGMIGMHGWKSTNTIINTADLVLALGVRFDDRATGNLSRFAPTARVVHIDVDAAEIGKLKTPDICLTADLGKTLSALIPLITENQRGEWLSEIRNQRDRDTGLSKTYDKPLHPVNIIKTINRLSQKDTIVTTDVGQHQMWAAQTWKFNTPRALLTSGGLGTMGFGLPAAIGAALANPEKQVVCITGDGSILMNIQELATLAELNLNIKIFVLNNGHLGLVRQQQELFYDKHYIASRFDNRVNFAAIADGFGISSWTLSDTSSTAELDNSIKSVLKPRSPALININIPEYENVLPMVPPGAGIDQQIG
ncbi:MAG: biosynthetic-type acetolactate synthase large subunit [Elusimicrobiota bacterium]